MTERPIALPPRRRTRMSAAMAGIVPHLPEPGAFGPSAIAAMSQALEEVCNVLQAFAGNPRGREAIAARIIDLARTGVLDAAALRDRVISEAWRLERA
jgi:hypothetical protein